MAHLRVRVTPGARESAIGEWQGDLLRLKVREAAEKGRANEAVARLLAKSLDVPPTSVTLKRGATSREKLFEIEGLDDAEVRRRLNAPML
ncbi:MAG: DUF167 domain-containing protein [Chloroflexota bacterium]